MPNTEVETNTKRFDGISSPIEEGDYRLPDDQVDFPLQPFAQALVVVNDLVNSCFWLDVDDAVVNLYRERPYVVCPQVKGPTAGQIETSVMPVAGKNSIVDRPAMQREAHMRASIIERIDRFAVSHEYEGLAPNGHWHTAR